MIFWTKLFIDRLKDGPMAKNELIQSLCNEIPPELAFRTYKHWQEMRIKRGKVKKVIGARTSDIIAARIGLVRNQIFVQERNGHIITDGDNIIRLIC